MPNSLTRCAPGWPSRAGRPRRLRGVTLASGIGSWPGTDPRSAIGAVRDLLLDGIPYLPELPARGPGAEMIGRAAGLLIDLHVDRQPAGWRFVDRPGRDAARTAAYLREDLDELAEAYDGWTGPLKVQVTGPWTLAASVELTRGERSVSDPGARREIAASLAEGARAHLARVQALVPGAQLVLQVDEPALPAVLAGTLPTQSGYGRLRSVDRAEVSSGLEEVLAAAGERPTVVHCCHPEAPVALIVGTGTSAVSLDLGYLGTSAWDQVAAAVEGGTTLWAGAVPTTGESAADWRAVQDAVLRPWHEVGLADTDLDRVVVTPSCGLASLPPSQAIARQRTAVEAALALTDL